VRYQLIARPLLERIDDAHANVQLTVLRPPTLEGLRETLTGAAAAGKPFHIIHFDCHGSFSDGKGQIIFEHRYGGPHSVPAPTLAQVVSAGGVSVSVLNACQSGAVGSEVETAIATALLRAGCASVVAMAYRVYAAAGADFMATFYESLFAGNTVSQAVTAGRRRLFEHNSRPSPKGNLSFTDWLVPLHYWRADIRFLPAQTDVENRELPKHEAWTGRSSHVAEKTDLKPVGSFVGRDEVFYEMETVARAERVLMLYGSAGTGKTEIVKAFGRWWRDTRGVDHPGWVLWHSFRPGVASNGLDRVISTIGLAISGAKFEKLDPDQQLAEVKSFLESHRALLIWDNFETAHSMPDPTGTTPPLDEEDCQQLKEFLSWIAEHSDSTVIVTSRTQEDWLPDICRIRLGGLSSEDSAEYANLLLAAYPDGARKRRRREFGELLRWLDGHPLSMRLIIPRLDTADPETLLEELQGITALSLSYESAGDTSTSLQVSITDSFVHLTAATRRILPAISLFQGVVDAEILSNFSDRPEVPERFSGVSEDGWKAALEEAVRVGLLTPIDGRMFRLHPVLPAYLGAQWRNEDGNGYEEARDECMRAMVTVCSTAGLALNEQVRFGDARQGYAILDQLHRTFGIFLRYALDRYMWDEAQAIVQPLESYWAARGLGVEADAWIDLIIVATQDTNGATPSVTRAEGRLWCVATSMKANRKQLTMRLDEADRMHRQILTVIQDQPHDKTMQLSMAISSLQLGTIAKDQGRLGDADAWYYQALAGFNELGDRPRIVFTYHQLGMLAELRERLKDAERWYSRSLAIAEQANMSPSIAATRFQLGVIAFKQGRRKMDIAEDHFLKALTIFEELDDRQHIMAAYHELGDVMIYRGQLDKAEGWFTDALLVGEEVGDQSAIAAAYHALGVVALGRRQQNDAQEWLHKALEIRARLGDRPHIGETYLRLGEIAEFERRQFDALKWFIRCAAVFDDFSHPTAQIAAERIALLAGKFGESGLKESWLEITGKTLPPYIVDNMAKLLARAIRRDIIQLWRDKR
jgi:tetratricopeptide (TPR) repeat protein